MDFCGKKLEVYSNLVVVAVKSRVEYYRRGYGILFVNEKNLKQKYGSPFTISEYKAANYAI